VPKKYVEKVGDDGFKKAPVGAGPYRFVSFNPGCVQRHVGSVGMTTQMNVSSERLNQNPNCGTHRCGPAGRCVGQWIRATVSRKVWRHDAIVPGEQRRNTRPGSAFARRPVDEDQGWAGSTVGEGQLRPTRKFQARHQRRSLMWHSSFI
jgi:hypothetical protein